MCLVVSSSKRADPAQCNLSSPLRRASCCSEWYLPAYVPVVGLDPKMRCVKPVACTGQEVRWEGQSASDPIHVALIPRHLGSSRLMLEFHITKMIPAKWQLGWRAFAVFMKLQAVVGCIRFASSVVSLSTWFWFMKICKELLFFHLLCFIYISPERHKTAVVALLVGSSVA